MNLEDQLLALAEELGGPLLAFDTSGTRAAVCTVAWRPGLVEQILIPAATMPSESLAQTLAAARDRACLDLATVCGIVVGIGPGSYTGLRVGLATAKGLAFGAGVPLYGTSSLAILAASAGPGLVAAVIDSRAGEVFGAVYDVTSDGSVRALVEDDAFTPEQIDKVIADLPGKVRRVGVNVDIELRAGFALLHAAERLRRGPSELDTLVPRYLRVSEAERAAGC